MVRTRRQRQEEVEALNRFWEDDASAGPRPIADVDEFYIALGHGEYPCPIPEGDPVIPPLVREALSRLPADTEVVIDRYEIGQNGATAVIKVTQYQQDAPPRQGQATGQARSRRSSQTDTPRPLRG